MRGVVFDLSLPRYGLAKALGRFRPQLYYGAGSCLSLDDVPEPRKPGPGWARLDTLYAGVCGSDLATIYLKSSPVLEPLTSLPCVLGHEILARVAEPPAGSKLRAGDRVVVDPILPCSLRGVATPCKSCARGHYGLCEAFARGHFAPGMMIGFQRELPGSWGDSMVAHESQLFRVPDAVPDERAALVEPLAVGTHAVLRRPPHPEEKVLVIGGGMIAFSVLAGLRLLELRPELVAHLTLLDYQAEQGRALGATHTILPQGGAAAVTAEVCRITGASAYQPIVGDAMIVGGFDLVYDCVGTQASLTDALRYVRSGGTIVLIGAAGVIERLDLTMIWAREINLIGSFTYGHEERDPGRRRTFEIVLDRLTDDTLARPLDRLVTHVFALEDYQEAIVANVERARTRSVKTLFRLRGGPAAQART